MKMMQRLSKRWVLAPHLLTQTLVHCKGGAAIGGAAGSGKSGGATKGNSDDSPLGNWIVYGPVLICIILITLCVLYDKVNNCLMRKRHDESHLSKRDYTRGSRKQGHEPTTEEEWLPMKTSRRTTAEETSLPKLSVNCGTSNYIPDGRKTVEHTTRENLERDQIRGSLDQHRSVVDELTTVSMMMEENIDNTSPTWDHEILLWDHDQQPAMDQQSVWEEKIALLDQKIALLEQEKPRYKHRDLHKQRSLDVTSREQLCTSKWRTKRPLKTTKSDTTVCASDHDASQEAADHGELSSNQQLPDVHLKTAYDELKLKSSVRDLSRPPLLASKSIGI